MAIPKPVFKGIYEGKGIWNYEGFDYSIDTIEGRIAKVKEIFNIVDEGDYNFSNDEFWKEVWDTGICKSGLNTTDFLWSCTNVASKLESAGNYILAMDDKENKVNYKIYEDERKFQMALNKEKKTIRTKGENISENDRVAFNILIPRGNYKLDPKPTITASDVKRHDVLKNYQDYLDYLTDNIQNVEHRQQLLERLFEKGCFQYKAEDKLKYELGQLKGDINNDMIDAKKSIERPIKWKQPLKDGGYVNYDEISLYDENVTKELLMLMPRYADKDVWDFQDDLECIMYDFMNLCDRVQFTEQQRNVLELYQLGITQKKIGEQLGIKVQVVNNHLKAIVKNIIKQYDIDEMYNYYLNVRKGQWKTCSKCGEVKLIQEFDKNGKRYMSMCKECRKNK